MKKFAIFLISATLLVCSFNLNAQTDGCTFRFVLKNPNAMGWSPEVGVKITVNDMNYGFLNLPWGTPVGEEREEIKLLPSGEIHFSWIGYFNSLLHYFEIYNSSNELIYASPESLPGELFFTYQNECCIALADFDGEYNQETKEVNLSWVAPTSVDLTGFNIYRNDELLTSVESSSNSYSSLTSGLQSGNYKYCVVPVYPFSCVFEEECFEVDIEVGIKNYDSTLSLYPNPATHSITISGDIVVNAKIYNSVGQLVLSHNTNVINVSVLTNGIYILAVETSTGNTIHKKIIINR